MIISILSKLNLIIFIILILEYNNNGVTGSFKLTNNLLKNAAQIGFICTRVQYPLFRGFNKATNVIFASSTIVKKTKVSIKGEIVYSLVCHRDSSRDQGDVMDEKNARAQLDLKELDRINIKPPIGRSVMKSEDGYDYVFEG